MSVKTTGKELDAFYAAATSTINARADAFSYADMLKAIEDPKTWLSAQRTDWLLIGPDGTAIKGQPEDLLRVLMPLHPLLRDLPPASFREKIR